MTGNIPKHPLTIQHDLTIPSISSHPDLHRFWAKLVHVQSLAFTRGQYKRLHTHQPGPESVWGIVAASSVATMKTKEKEKRPPY